ncbi:hypothetical protein F2P56_003817 [Juglans regia]|uniref:Reverse transcriptase domain-containing protein n=1 Tax=Juglans regia TaxID=51240 RepID=A0A834D4S4_JUGRE|nr:hypothetical protein F2P56_003817 [Juglans regia]
MVGIADAFCQYYRALFSSVNPCGLDACLSHIQPSVNEDMNNNLLSPFIPEEVKEAVFQMNPLGSPGPDGFPAIFYQSHWGVVGGDVTKAVLEVLNHGGDLKSINDTFIIISPTQSAFVPGRMILDNVIVAFEALHSMSTIGKGKQGYMAVKLDMNKAYDRVEWAFLEKVMMKMGFNPRWISLIMNCITSVSYSILINGAPQASFVPSRGIRQGDPLSPYLFILVSEVLSSLLNHAENVKDIHGFPICKGNLSINHLFFADDSLLFCRANVMEWAAINRLLGLYENASGHQLNKAKTSIFFSANTRQELRNHILSIAGTRSTSCYETYLGLPALIGRSRHADFKGILDRMRDKISNWKTKFLSFAGKEILLKAVIQALPTYCMGVFKLPKSLLHEINRIMHQFWWGHMHNEKKVHWVSWGQMGKAKGASGLGFRDFESFNLALLAKQGWRIIQVPDSLAAKVLKMKYFPTSDFLQAKMGVRPSFMWRSLCAARELIKKGSIWRIGNGQDTKIWNYRWLPQPSSYMVQTPIQVLHAEARVAELITEETKQWNRGLVVSVLGNEVAEVVFKIPISFTGASDRLIWLGTKDGQFTVKSAYHKQKELQDLNKGQTSYRAKNLKDWTGFWKLQIPNVTKVFIWKACLESLPTRLNLYKKKIVDSPLCPICSREEESVTHILWSCSSAMDVWSQGPKAFQKCTNSAGCFKDLVEQFLSSIDTTLMELFSMTTRGIWLRRNKMVFENSFMHPMQVARQAAIHLTEFKAAHFGSKREVEQSLVHPSVWVPPPENFIKINWDAAVSSIQNRTGIGLVARDHLGSIVASKKLSRSGVLEPLLAEALGGFYAVGMAKVMGLQAIWLEGDSQGVTFVKRSDNQVAHCLARDSLELTEDVSELSVPINRLAGSGQECGIRVLKIQLSAALASLSPCPGPWSARTHKSIRKQNSQCTGTLLKSLSMSFCRRRRKEVNSDSDNERQEQTLPPKWLPPKWIENILTEGLFLWCVLSVTVDPLFFYVPVINEERKCVALDRRLYIRTTCLRTVLDSILLVDIILQCLRHFAKSEQDFACGGILESCQNVSERAEMTGTENPPKLLTLLLFLCRLLFRYLKFRSELWSLVIDVLAILPVPQLLLPIIFSKLGGSESLNKRKVLTAVVLFQYLPRAIRIYLSSVSWRNAFTHDGGSRDKLSKSVIAVKAGFNLFMFIVASHVSYE